MAVNKKKKKISIETAIIHIHTTMNNTIITMTDENGMTFLQESAGKCGYKGTKKSAPYVANIVATKIGKEALDLGIKNAIIKINGIGKAKEVILRTFVGLNFNIFEIADVTPIPHNGCSPSKKPR